MKKRYILREDQVSSIAEAIGRGIRRNDFHDPETGAYNPPVDRAKMVSGHIKAIANDQGEFLFADRNTGEKIYTYIDMFNDKNETVYDFFYDYLNVEKEYEQSEDEWNLVPVDNWTDNIDNDELMGAIASYLNDKISNHEQISITDDYIDYLSGNYHFFKITPKVTPDQVDDIIMSKKLKELANPNNPQRV